MRACSFAIFFLFCHLAISAQAAIFSCHESHTSYTNLVMTRTDDTVTVDLGKEYDFFAGASEKIDRVRFRFGLDQCHRTPNGLWVDPYLVTCIGPSDVSVWVRGQEKIFPASHTVFRTNRSSASFSIVYFEYHVRLDLDGETLEDWQFFTVSPKNLSSCWEREGE